MHKIKILVAKHKQTLIIAAGFLLVVIFTMTFIVPQKVVFSYSGATCVKRLIILPGLYRSVGADYRADYRNTIKIGSVPILSSSVCITPLKAPQKGVTSAGLGLFGSAWFQQHLNVSVNKPVSINTEPLTRPIGFSKSLVLQMEAADVIFTYTININDKVITCKSTGQQLSCPVKEAGLQPSQEYAYTLNRYFAGSVAEKLKSAKVKTLNAVQVSDATIKPGDTVYDKRRTATITFDKPLVAAKGQLFKIKGEAAELVAFKQNVSDNTLVLNWDADLERETTYEIRVVELEAKDGSSLVGTYTSRFFVSGGPKVSGISILKTGVAIGARIALTFDQPISQSQNISGLVTVAGIPATITRSGSQLFITLQSGAKCADFTVQVKPGILSAHDIPGKEGWSYSARTICHTIQTIGYSARGRAIGAYYFGNGGTSVLYVGAIHGNEVSSSYILKDWISYLEQNAKNIPADRQIVVVPTLNPDGVAAGARNNASNVNLNRNFATNDWKKDINDTSGTVVNGGGTAPMSEPETNAIAALANRIRPRLTLSYHAVGSVAIANGAGGSNAAAAVYAGAVGYNNGTGNSEEIFQYEITGTFDDWLAQNLGLGSVVVELGSYQYRNFLHHKAAMWDMATR